MLEQSVADRLWHAVAQLTEAGRYVAYLDACEAEARRLRAPILSEEQRLEVAERMLAEIAQA